MKKHLAAAAIAALFAPPALATTFPSFTTIYVGSGVRDSGHSSDAGLASIFMCSNVSGISASIRFQVLSSLGSPVGTASVTIAHGATYTAGSHFTASFNENVDLDTGAVLQGAVNIESTQSAVFCTAAVIDAAGNPPSFTLPLHLVRVNSHPGTVE